MSMNEADTRYHLIDPVLREKGYVSRECITLETVLLELAAHVEELVVAGHTQAAANAAAVIAALASRARRTIH